MSALQTTYVLNEQSINLEEPLISARQSITTLNKSTIWFMKTEWSKYIQYLMNYSLLYLDTWLWVCSLCTYLLLIVYNRTIRVSRYCLTIDLCSIFGKFGNTHKNLIESLEINCFCLPRCNMREVYCTIFTWVIM